MTTMTELELLIGAIRTGEGDDDIERVLDTVLARRKYLDDLESSKLKVGDRVAFNDRTKPKYMVGASGTIIEKRRTKLVIEMDEEHGRFGKEAVAPGSLLTKLGA